MLQRLLRSAKDDTGAAVITTLLVMVVVTGLGTVVVQVASANLRNAGRDRVAGGALGAAEAGLAAGQAYLQGPAGISTLACSTPTTICTSNPWGNRNAPYELVISTDRKAYVYLVTEQAFNPPTTKKAVYRIYSTGTTGTGPGTVKLEQQVSAEPFSFPIGVYADAIGAAGGAEVHRETFFTDGCVQKRSHMTFEGIDQWYGTPAGVYSTKWITESNNGCSENDNSNIHKTSDCNTSFPYDRDFQGGPLASTACGAVPNAIGSSYFDSAALEASYGKQARGLTTAQYAALKTRAQSMGQYYTTASYSAPDPAMYPNAVMYFKIAKGQKVMIQDQLNAYSYDSCGTRSLVIVVEGGDMHVNAGANITAAIFLPDGTYTGNGSSQIHGTLFAKYIEKFNGTADFALDPCFFANLPGGLLTVSPMQFRVNDR